MVQVIQQGCKMFAQITSRDTTSRAFLFLLPLNFHVWEKSRFEQMKGWIRKLNIIILLILLLEMYNFATITRKIMTDFFSEIRLIFLFLSVYFVSFVYCGMGCSIGKHICYANVIFLDVAFSTLLFKLSTIFLWSTHVMLCIHLICCLHPLLIFLGEDTPHLTFYCAPRGKPHRLKGLPAGYNAATTSNSTWCIPRNISYNPYVCPNVLQSDPVSTFPLLQCF